MDVKSRVRWIIENHPRPDGDKWSAKQLSLVAGLSQSHVGQIARGDVDNVDTETLEAIAKAAGVSPAWLVLGTGDPTPDHTSEVPTGPGDPRFADLAAWPALRDAAAQLRPTAPQWVWEQLARARPLLPGAVSVGQVVDLADIVLRYGSPPPSTPAASPRAPESTAA